MLLIAEQKLVIGATSLVGRTITVAQDGIFDIELIILFYV
jgi:hypothetical protein